MIWCMVVTFESRKSGKVRNVSELKKQVKQLQWWNAKYRKEIAELKNSVKHLQECLNRS